jgi:8-oxo-dGTP diphosphatase
MGTSVSWIINRALYYPVVAVFLFNLIQRRYMDRGLGKRFATLYIGLLLLIFWGVTFFLIRFSLSDLFLIPSVLILIFIGWYWRSRIFPFRLTCRKCGARLSLKSILTEDANMCRRHIDEEHPKEES